MADRVREAAEALIPVKEYRAATGMTLGVLRALEKGERQRFIDGARWALSELQSPESLEAMAMEMWRDAGGDGKEETWAKFADWAKSFWIKRAERVIKAAIERVTGGSE